MRGPHGWEAAYASTSPERTDKGMWPDNLIAERKGDCNGR